MFAMSRVCRASPRPSGPTKGLPLGETQASTGMRKLFYHVSIPHISYIHPISSLHTDLAAPYAELRNGQSQLKLNHDFDATPSPVIKPRNSRASISSSGPALRSGVGQAPCRLSRQASTRVRHRTTTDIRSRVLLQL